MAYFRRFFPGLLQDSQPSGRGSTWIAGGPVHGRGTQARMVPSGRSVTENFKSWNVNIGSFVIWLIEINSLMLPFFSSVTSSFSRAKSSLIASTSWNWINLIHQKVLVATRYINFFKQDCYLLRTLMEMEPLSISWSTDLSALTNNYHEKTKPKKYM